MSFSCIVCLDDYVNKSKERIVWSRKCGHIFHHQCLIRWLATCRQKKNPESCPKCGLAMNVKIDLQVLYDEVNPGLPAKRTFPKPHPAEVLNKMEVTPSLSVQQILPDGDVAMEVDDPEGYNPEVKRSKP